MKGHAPALLRQSASSLVEVVFSLSLVAFAFGALFSVFSSSFPLLRGQQDTIAANLSLQERLDFLRSLSWPVLTTPTRLRAELVGTGLRSAATLAEFSEDIAISVYPTPAAIPVPLRVSRKANGTVEAQSQPTDGSLLASPMVRVDLLHTWELGGRTHTRGASAIIAYGGNPK